MVMPVGVVSILLIAIVSMEARAQMTIPGYPPQVNAYDAREVARLPNYCRYTQAFRSSVPGGNDQAQINYWYSVMGETFHAMHHYCWGLMKLNRALYLSRTAQTRNFYLNDAIQEFNYVLERSPERFILLPEMLSKKAQALIRLGRGPVAVPLLEQAIELKPDYWPPSVQLSDYYKSVGNIEMARKVLENAISASPNVESLKKHLAELNGARDKTAKGAK